MARQGNLHFAGRKENLIFYQWRGVPCIRTKPLKVKRVKTAIGNSKIFALASHTGAKLRKLLKPALPDAKDRNMMRRFEQSIAQWLRTKGAGSSTPQTDLPFITGFDFNEESELRTRLKVNVSVSVNAANNLVVTIPGIVPVNDINAPAHTISVIMQVQAAVCSMQNDDYTNSANKSFNLLYNSYLMPPQQIEFPIQIESRCLALVIISLAYIITKTSGPVAVKDKRWLPAGVAGGIWVS
jgi:hypothetical protein